MGQLGQLGHPCLNFSTSSLEFSRCMNIAELLNTSELIKGEDSFQWNIFRNIFVCWLWGANRFAAMIDSRASSFILRIWWRLYTATMTTCPGFLNISYHWVAADNYEVVNMLCIALQRHDNNPNSLSCWVSSVPEKRWLYCTADIWIKRYKSIQAFVDSSRILNGSMQLYRSVRVTAHFLWDDWPGQNLAEKRQFQSWLREPFKNYLADFFC